MTLESLGTYGVRDAGEIVGAMLLPDNQMAAWDDKDMLQAPKTRGNH